MNWKNKVYTVQSTLHTSSSTAKKLSVENLRYLQNNYVFLSHFGYDTMYWDNVWEATLHDSSCHTKSYYMRGKIAEKCNLTQLCIADVLDGNLNGNNETFIV